MKRFPSLDSLLYHVQICLPVCQTGMGNMWLQRVSAITKITDGNRNFII